MDRSGHLSNTGLTVASTHPGTITPSVSIRRSVRDLDSDGFGGRF